MGRTRLWIILLAVTGVTIAIAASVAQGSPTQRSGSATSSGGCCRSRGTHLGGPLFGTGSYQSVRGHADYHSRRGHRDFDVDLWNAGKLAGKTLTVFAGGHKIGTMRVARGGGCHLHRDTDRGQSVPRLSAGATVSAKTSTGTLVASGTLHRMRMM